MIDTRVGVYAVIIRDGRILLPHWSEGPFDSGWTLPGGGMEDGESTEQTVLREVLEETGYEVELDGLLGTDTFYISAEERIVGTGPLRSLRIVYRAHVIGGDLRVEADGSTDDVAWVSLDRLPELNRVELIDSALAMLG